MTEYRASTVKFILELSILSILGGYPGGDCGIEPQLKAKSPCKGP